MKKLLTVVFTVLLGATLSFAQHDSAGTHKATADTATKAQNGGNKGKSEKKGHKRGKKSKKGTIKPDGALNTTHGSASN